MHKVILLHNFNTEASYTRLMGDFYKTCDIHGKPFPNNQIDTRKTKMYKLYGEQKTEIEGKTVKMSLFVDKNAENEGIDVCAMCMQEKVINLLTATDNTPAYKIVQWNPVTKTKKDGTTYERNEMTVLTQEEMAEQIKAEKKVAPISK